MNIDIDKIKTPAKQEENNEEITFEIPSENLFASKFEEDGEIEDLTDSDIVNKKAKDEFAINLDNFKIKIPQANPNDMSMSEDLSVDSLAQKSFASQPEDEDDNNDIKMSGYSLDGYGGSLFDKKMDNPKAGEDENKEESEPDFKSSQFARSNKVSSFFTLQKQKQLKEIIETSPLFSPAAKQLAICGSAQIAMANDSNGSQYSQNQIEKCFEKYISDSKQAVDKAKKTLDEASGNMVTSPFFFLALAMYVITDTWEKTKQLHFQVIERRELRELANFTNLTETEKFKTIEGIEREIQGYNDNVQTAEQFIDGVQKDITENLDEAAKISSNNKYKTAHSMLEEDFLNKELTPDEIKHLSEKNSHLETAWYVPKEAEEFLINTINKADTKIANIDYGIGNQHKFLDDMIGEDLPKANEQYFAAALERLKAEREIKDTDRRDFVERAYLIQDAYNEAYVDALSKQDTKSAMIFAIKSQILALQQEKIKEFGEKIFETEKIDLSQRIKEIMDDFGLSEDEQNKFANEISSRAEAFFNANKETLQKQSILMDLEKGKKIASRVALDMEKEAAVALKDRHEIFLNKNLKQADKIAVELTDNLFSIIFLHKEHIDKNLDLLKKMASENLEQITSQEKIKSSNAYIAKKVVEKLEIDEGKKKELESILSEEINKFHQKVADTGEMDFTALTKDIKAAMQKHKDKFDEEAVDGISQRVVAKIDEARLINKEIDYICKDADRISECLKSIDSVNFYNENIRYSGKNIEILEEKLRKIKNKKNLLLKFPSGKDFATAFFSKGASNKFYSREDKENKNKILNKAFNDLKDEKLANGTLSKIAPEAFLKELSEKLDLPEDEKKIIANLTVKDLGFGNILRLQTKLDKLLVEEKINQDLVDNLNKTKQGIYKKIYELIHKGDADKLQNIIHFLPVDKFPQEHKFLNFLNKGLNRLDYVSEITKRLHFDPAHFTKVMPARLMFMKLHFGKNLESKNRPELSVMQYSHQIKADKAVDKKDAKSAMDYLVSASTNTRYATKDFLYIKDEKEKTRSLVFSQKFDTSLPVNDNFRIIGLLKGAGYTPEQIKKLPLDRLGFAKKISAEALKVLDISASEMANVKHIIQGGVGIQSAADFAKMRADLEHIAGDKINNILNANAPIKFKSLAKIAGNKLEEGRILTSLWKSMSQAYSGTKTIAGNIGDNVFLHLSSNLAKVKGVAAYTSAEGKEAIQKAGNIVGFQRAKNYSDYIHSIYKKKIKEAYGSQEKLDDIFIKNEGDKPSNNRNLKIKRY